MLKFICADMDAIFVTTYDSYALHAFKVDAVDCPLKRFSAECFAEMRDEASGRMAHDERVPAPSWVVVSAQGPDALLERV